MMTGAESMKRANNGKGSVSLDEISIIDFDHTDVVRHPLVNKIVKAYEDVKND